MGEGTGAVGFALTPKIAEGGVGALARADPRERGQSAVLRAMEELVHVVGVLGGVGPVVSGSSEKERADQISRERCS